MPTKPADGKTKPDIEENPTTTAIVVRMSEQPFAVMVDEIIGRQQVVIKKLGIEIGTIKGIIGGAILGDGNAALILDLPELIVSRKATGGYGNLRRAS
jgi:chemotaxis protein histidine kinase CheA